jgi:glycosyltransferase involved in cell wall biosynthesis
MPEQRLRVALISTDFPPQRTSAAVQMRDLAQEVRRRNHEPVVIVPTAGLREPWRVEDLDGVTVLRLAAPATRDLSYLRRTLGEFVLPFAAMRHLTASPMRDTRWDMVVWYSPTIFFGPLVWWLKRRTQAHLYLILRDIFPEWAVDLGLLRKGIAYRLLKAVANLQYRVADTIGVQTHSNLAYLQRWHHPPRRTIEVLQNWQAPTPNIGSSILVNQTPLAGRTIFGYIGNMGVAQAMDIFIDLAQSLRHRVDIGFLFVGRGSESARLASEARRRGLTNMLFYPEVDAGEMPGLLAQCRIGLIALDPRHRTHNIPGKFLTYMLAGLPVLARINAGTDLERLIQDERVGTCYSGDSIEELKLRAEALIDAGDELARMAERGRGLARRLFTPEAAVERILAAHRPPPGRA